MDKIFSPLPIDCVALDETAIAKSVGLTRRIAAIERQYHRERVDVQAGQRVAWMGILE